MCLGLALAWDVATTFDAGVGADVVGVLYRQSQTQFGPDRADAGRRRRLGADDLGF